MQEELGDAENNKTQLEQCHAKINSLELELLSKSSQNNDNLEISESEQVVELLQKKLTLLMK